jgi:hypothetical protein
MPGGVRYEPPAYGTRERLPLDSMGMILGVESLF